jgi:hypothetical protein
LFSSRLATWITGLDNIRGQEGTNKQMDESMHAWIVIAVEGRITNRTDSEKNKE